MTKYEMVRTYLLQVDTESEVFMTLFGAYPFFRNDHRARTWTKRMPNGTWMHKRYYIIEAKDEDGVFDKLYTWYPELQKDEHLHSFEIKPIAQVATGFKLLGKLVLENLTATGPKYPKKRGAS